MAYLLDILIYWSIGGLFSFLLGTFTIRDGWMGFRFRGWPAVCYVLVILLLLPVQEGLTGKTLGKRVMGIRVLRKDYTKSSFRRSVIRHFFDGPDLARLWMQPTLLRRPRERWGDRVAGTVVVRDGRRKHEALNEA